MNISIDTIKNIRHLLVQMVKDLPLSALNEVPAGFNNNIIWNVAHLVAAQQGICYLRSGVTPVVDEKFITPYKAGTKPEAPVDENTLQEILSTLQSSIIQLEVDYNNNLFAGYTTWTTRSGYEIKDIDTALSFLLFHEGLHTGYIMALKRLINNPA